MRLLIVAKVSKNPLFCAKIPALEMKKIMAIVNLTPDSFYPGSRVYAEDGTFDASAFLFQVRSAHLMTLLYIKYHLFLQYRLH